MNWNGARRFFLIVLALSLPFWLPAGATLPIGLPLQFPIVGLAAFLPGAVALGLVSRERGRAGAARMLKRAVQAGGARQAPWSLAALLLMPAVMVAAFAIQRAAGTVPPHPQVPLGLLTYLFPLFFLLGVGEELGWQGYAYERLAERHSATASTLILGLFWASWHVIPDFGLGHDLRWTAWQWLTTILLRIVTVFLYLSGGRTIFIAALFHAMSNAAVFLFPVYGSHYDPMVAFLILAPIAGLIVARWSARKPLRPPTRH